MHVIIWVHKGEIYKARFDYERHYVIVTRGEKLVVYKKGMTKQELKEYEEHIKSKVILCKVNM